jgi:hypothetical protein
LKSGVAKIQLLREAVECELSQRKKICREIENKTFTIRFVLDERQRACLLMSQLVELASLMPDLQHSLPHGDCINVKSAYIDSFFFVRTKCFRFITFISIGSSFIS